MLVEGQKVAVNWHPRNKRHLQLLGYKFTRYKDSLIIPAEHLPFGSNYKVKVQCDYCLSIVEQVYGKYYKMVIKHSLNKAACNKCNTKKSQEEYFRKYGVVSYLQTDEGQEKHQSAVFDKYGVRYAGQSDEIKEKIRSTIKENYGTEHYFQSDDFQETRKVNSKEWYQDRKQKYGKLEEVEIIAILKMRFEDGTGFKEIIELFSHKVNKGAIYDICSGRKWRNITVPYLKSKHQPLK